MEFAVSQEQGRVPVTVIRLAGRINLSNAEEFEKQAQSIFQNGARELLIDLAQVESITSAGLRAILATTKLFGGDSAGSNSKSPYVKLLAPTSPVRQVLKIAGFDSFLEIHNDLKNAVASF